MAELAPSDARERAMLAVPSWLQPFLSQEYYFSKCTVHAGKLRRFFCIDCRVGPLCCVGKDKDHKDHGTLQIERAASSSTGNCTAAVRRVEMAKHINISYVQPYGGPCRQVVYLDQQGDEVGDPTIPVCGVDLDAESGRNCLHCGYELSVDNCFFCSVACKLFVVRQQLEYLDAAKNSATATATAIKAVPSHKLRFALARAPSAVRRRRALARAGTSSTAGREDGLLHMRPALAARDDVELHVNCCDEGGGRQPIDRR